MQPAATSPARTSGWSVASWAFFILTALASVVAVASVVASGAVASEPYVGPVFSLFLILGAGTGWLVALVCAALGTLCGSIGLVSPARRTGPAWAALGLNAAFVIASVAVMLTATG